MRMVAARADSPLATSCTMTEETRELARGSPGDPARSGGRLKFFKDGKFILELVRAGAEGACGGGGGWVSVPRKTFWPPPAAPSATPPHSATHTHHLRTDRAASLSVSDDNSSVQSSPWQRDHCWKQTTPHKNISKQLALYYCRPSNLLNSTIGTASRAKRRRPLDTTHTYARANGSRPLSNGVCADNTRNGNSDKPSGSPPADDRDHVERWMDRERYYHMKLKKPYQYHKLRVYKKCRPPARRKPLSEMIDRLKERATAMPTLVNAKLANCRQEHAMVSPRKRILRELERVCLEDQSGKRRAKTVPALSTASYPPSPGPSHAVPRAPDTPPARSNGSSSRRDTPKHVGSYSIHSLLSMPDDSPPECKRRTPSIKTESPSSVHSPDLSPSPDGYRHRHSLALSSPSGVRASPHPPPPPPDWRDSVYMYGGYPPAAFLPPQLYRPPPPPPPPLPWVHYIPPGPWAPLPHPLLTHHIPKEEPSSDLPLNLSKH